MNDLDTVVNWKKIQRGLPKARLRANDRSPMAAAPSPPSVAPVIDLALPLSVALVSVALAPTGEYLLR
jgi:hypothetical protein